MKFASCWPGGCFKAWFLLHPAGCGAVTHSTVVYTAQGMLLGVGVGFMDLALITLDSLLGVGGERSALALPHVSWCTSPFQALCRENGSSELIGFLTQWHFMSCCVF